MKHFCPKRKKDFSFFILFFEWAKQNKKLKCQEV